MELVAFLFHLAALDVGSIRGGFFFVLTIAALAGIQGAAAVGTDAVVGHYVSSALIHQVADGDIFQMVGGIVNGFSQHQ